jgi:CheY-like chemotaxis protein
MLKGIGRSERCRAQGVRRKEFFQNIMGIREYIMLKLLLISPDEDSLSGIAAVLKEHDDVEFLTAKSGEKALAIVSKNAVDLVVTDEELGDMSGLEFARRLISLNPAINCACVSHLGPERFHDASEGLGLMDRLPIRPGKEDSERLLWNLRLIKGEISP